MGVAMAHRKTIRSLDSQAVLPVLAALVGFAAIGVLVHGLMWAHTSDDESADQPVKAPHQHIHVSSKTMAA